MLRASFVDGCWWKRWPHRRCPVDLAAALQSDGHRQSGLAVPERDDARPTRESLWIARWAEPGGRTLEDARSGNLGHLNFLAAVLPNPRDPRTDWEGIRLRQFVQVVLQTRLDLGAVITASAAREQNPGECQRNAQEAQPNTPRPLEPHRPPPGGVRHHKVILGGRRTNIRPGRSFIADPRSISLRRPDVRQPVLGAWVLPEQHTTTDPLTVSTGWRS
jgi:hypothetical protein